jgi:hypothetical protein
MSGVQALWVERQLGRLPPPLLAGILARHTELIGTRTAESTSELYVANRWLSDTTRRLKAANVGAAYDEEKIRVYADNWSRNAAKLASLERRLAYAQQCAIRVDPRGKTEAGLMLRLEDSKYWRRQLRTYWTSHAEDICRSLGYVHRRLAPYVTDHGKAHFIARSIAMRRWIDRQNIVNEEGEQLSLALAVDSSVSHPRIRRTELMVRMRGFEETAQHFKHVGTMATLTAPSAFHARTVNGEKNPNYKGFSSSDAQRWLCTMWARARAKLKRLSVLYYGVRVVEPHHDGTPHWHMVYFCAPHQAATVRTVLEKIWLKEYGDEAGAAHVRCQFVTMDPAKGSAAGYIGKYIAKNIDGHGVIGPATDDESDEDCRTACVRIRAWASVNRIRQFQQIGGPPVTLWREVRRIKEEQLKDRDIKRAWRAATSNSWCGFTHAVGSIRLGRHTSLKLHKEETGLCNRYKEPRPPCTVGVRYASSIVLTRLHSWKLEKKSASGLAPDLTWTRSNNCTKTKAPNTYGNPKTWSNPRETSQAPPRHRH